MMTPEEIKADIEAVIQKITELPHCIENEAATSHLLAAAMFFNPKPKDKEASDA